MKFQLKKFKKKQNSEFTLNRFKSNYFKFRIPKAFNKYLHELSCHRLLIVKFYLNSLKALLQILKSNSRQLSQDINFLSVGYKLLVAIKNKVVMYSRMLLSIE